jgi:hypothetical protein
VRGEHPCVGDVTGLGGRHIMTSSNMGSVGAAGMVRGEASSTVCGVVDAESGSG